MKTEYKKKKIPICIVYSVFGYTLCYNVETCFLTYMYTEKLSMGTSILVSNMKHIGVENFFYFFSRNVYTISGP